MGRYLSIICLVLACSYADIGFSADNNNDYIIVTAEGVGKNRIDAIEQAWLEAIRSSVGMMVDVRTEINQDDISENIIAHSRGLVERYEIIAADDRSAEGYAITLKAWVRKDILRDGLEYVASQGQVMAFSIEDLHRTDDIDPNAGESLDSKQLSKETQEKEAAALVRNLIEKYPSSSFVKLRIHSKPTLVQGKKDTLQLEFELEFDSDLYYSRFLPEAKSVFGQVAECKLRKYYRDQAVIETIRKLQKDGRIDGVPSIFQSGAKNSGGLVLPDKLSTFAYDNYLLPEICVKDIMPLLDENNPLVLTLPFSVVFQDSTGEEIFQIKEKFDFSTFVAYMKTPVTVLMGSKIIQSANSSIFIHRKEDINSNTSVWKTADKPLEYEITKATDQFAMFSHSNKHIGYISANQLTKFLSDGRISTAAFFPEYSIYFYPSILVNGNTECTKYVFTKEFIMPEEILTEIKSISLNIL